MSPTRSDLLVAVNRQAVYGQVARWLIHDLRNPAQALALVSGLMNDDPGASDLKVAETVQAATSHLTRSLELLDRLLRLPPGNDEPAPLSLSDALQFVAAVYQTHRMGVTLEIDGGSGGPLPAIVGVEFELEHILLNLLLHAIEEPSGRVEGKIVVRATPDPAGARVTVVHDGQPVATERQAPSFKESGLAVARLLAERHGGSLEYMVGADGRAGLALLLPRWRRRATRASNSPR